MVLATNMLHRLFSDTVFFTQKFPPATHNIADSADEQLNIYHL